MDSKHIRPTWSFALVGTILLSSCTGPSDPEASLDAGSDERSSFDASMIECRSEETRSCTCDDGMSGRRSCRSGRFGDCVCASTRADSGRPSSTPALCKAGFYVGNFTGMYLPAMSGGGLFPPELGVMVSGKQLNDIPPLSFTLNENQRGAGEFTSFTVGNGCMAGSAQVFGVIDNPFVARIAGDLDCRTGYFDGWLDGQYTLFNLSPVPTAFSGPFTAQFQLPQSLLDGEWDVSEGISALTGGSSGGGMGTWNADWSASEAPASTEDPCAAIPVTDGGVRDSGATSD